MTPEHEEWTMTRLRLDPGGHWFWIRRHADGTTEAAPDVHGTPGEFTDGIIRVGGHPLKIKSPSSGPSPLSGTITIIGDRLLIPDVMSAKWPEDE